MDLGFVTHGVHANSHLVYLINSVISDDKITVAGPPSAWTWVDLRPGGWDT